jgi:hypothetical protein
MNAVIRFDKTELNPAVMPALFVIETTLAASARQQGQ